MLTWVKEYKINFCKYCAFEKQHKVMFQMAIHNTKGILDYVHSDVWGASPVRLKGGVEYFIILLMISQVKFGYTSWSTKVKYLPHSRSGRLKSKNPQEDKLDTSELIMDESMHP